MQFEKRRFYTTGQAGKILGMTGRMVTKCIEQEKLRGALLPGTNHRRIGHEALVDFMVANITLFGPALQSLDQEAYDNATKAQSS